MNLDDTINHLIGIEGGYSNNPSDSGGETMWGITIAVARAHGYMGPMNMLPRSTAVAIYKSQFWLDPQLDKVNQISQKIAEEMLDTAVNMGPGIAGGFLQRALNVLNKRGSMFPDLTRDGRVGAMTLSALKTFLTVRGPVEGETVLMRLLNDQQGVRYIELAEQADKNEDFEFGWVLNRVS